MPAGRPGAAPAAGQRGWARFSIIALAAAALMLLSFLMLAYLVDPYDTGRPGFFTKAGVRPQGPRISAASRGRDLNFNAAIIGNSHVQLLSPERLAVQTGLRFVSLAIPGTLPKEQLVLLDWFSRQRQAKGEQHSPRAIILGIDGNWCADNPALPNDKPFPFWLFERSVLAYGTQLLRYDILEEVPRRIAYLASETAERDRPDGYWDYEVNYRNLGYLVRPERRQALEVERHVLASNTTGNYPAAVALEKALKSLPASSAVIMVHPPAYVASLPVPSDPRWENDARCKQAFAKVAASRPRTIVVDWRKDGAHARDPSLWFDSTHYSQAIAVMIEADLAGRIAPLQSQ
jgi:hypothetical protein